MHHKNIRGINLPSHIDLKILVPSLCSGRNFRGRLELPVTGMSGRGSGSIRGTQRNCTFRAISLCSPEPRQNLAGTSVTRNFQGGRNFRAPELPSPVSAASGVLLSGANLLCSPEPVRNLAGTSEVRNFRLLPELPGCTEICLQRPDFIPTYK